MLLLLLLPTILAFKTLTNDEYLSYSTKPSVIFSFYDENCLSCDILNRKLNLISTALSNLKLETSVVSVNYSTVPSFPISSIPYLEAVYLARNNFELVEEITDESMSNIETFLVKF